KAGAALAAQQLAQPLTATMQPRHDRADGNTENLGSLDVAKFLQPDQQDNLLLLARQAAEGIAQGSDRKMVFLRRACRRLETGSVEGSHGRGAIFAAAVVDADVVHDRKEPAPNVAPTPQMGATPGPLQAVLNEVVCPLAVPHQGERVASEMRDLRRDQVIKIVYGRPPLRGLMDPKRSDTPGMNNAGRALTPLPLWPRPLRLPLSGAPLRPSRAPGGCPQEAYRTWAPRRG